MTEEKDIRMDIVDYLKSQGWGIILIGEHGVKKPDPTPFKYEYTMSFLGKKIEDSEFKENGESQDMEETTNV